MKTVFVLVVVGFLSSCSLYQDLEDVVDAAADMVGQSDMAGDMPNMPDMPDIDEPICFGEGDCANGRVCKVDDQFPGLNECVDCIEDADCGDPRLTCSDSNECIGCLAGGTCPTMADRCDPESEAPGTCVECLGDGSDTLCGEQPCDPESRRCVPCMPGDDALGTEDTCADNTRCKVDDADTTQNSCVECLASEDCATGGCDAATNTCLTCVEDTDCADGLVCTQEADLNVRMCVPCLGNSCNTGVCKEDPNDPSQNTCVECLVKDDCSGDDVCNPTSNLCVECVSNDGCSGGVCDTNNTCVGCLSNADCPGEVCDMTTKECLACLGDTDCPGTNQCRINADSTQNACVTCVNNNGCQDRSASVCNSAAHSCGVCQSLSDCGHLAGTYNYCDGGCIQCYGTSEQADCGTTFCALGTNMCSATPFGNVVDRSVCSSSNQCTAGSRCVPLSYQGAALGNYCMPLTTLNAAACPGPYGAQKQSRTTVEGQTVLVCMIDETRTTPDAIVEASFQNTCSTLGNDCQDQASECTLKDSTNRMCTYPCLTNSHCDAGDGLSCKCPGMLNTCAAADRRCLP